MKDLPKQARDALYSVIFSFIANSKIGRETLHATINEHQEGEYKLLPTGMFNAAFQIMHEFRVVSAFLEIQFNHYKENVHYAKHLAPLVVKMIHEKEMDPLLICLKDLMDFDSISRKIFNQIHPGCTYRSHYGRLMEEMRKIDPVLMKNTSKID